MNFSSKLLENAVNEMSQLPGIGKRTALRLVLFLLQQPKSQTKDLSNSLIELIDKVILCKSCNNISDYELCEICSNNKRDKSTICVVEDIRDVMAIESTGQYTGIYHVLGGKISPIEGIGPNQLNISSLIEKVNHNDVSEIIFALSATMEGDTTNFYLYKQLLGNKIKITTIARGVSVGNELEYTDEVTLGRSIIKRIPFENSIKNIS
ncbi:MAG: recombination protein RecR [Flavobacteriaceae bacterium]|jgi:recombination protein RecR|nr:recombination protein RecR [Pelagibacterales bacterium]MBT4709113.1 recombination protein RecR [Flavobacteriaceae bacterium]MBT4959041.1 recombination protein RecR [Flavobacteriaceae bacterium]MBT6169708.1 recombination protein RecR [Flavobacteriaceae bacterium]MDG1830260.1 recombination mediator RecR [Flavobacteriaceae bacterium]|tara:strand:- start:429 stop:1052 length:624 start_codon:yes stop_codon:yes gene_type:complete